MIQSRKTRKIRQIWLKAKKHKKASRLGLPAGNFQYELCECCDQVVDKQPMSYWENTKQFEVFGFGYSLWFSFLRYCIVLIIVLIATSTADQIYMATEQNKSFCYPTEINIKSNQIPNNINQIRIQHNKQKNNLNSLHLRYFQKKYQNLQKNQNSKQIKQNSKQKNQQIKKSQTQCTSFMVYLSIFKGQQMYSSAFLRIINFIIHLITLIAIRSVVLKQLEYYNQRKNLISDYALIISNLPPVQGIKAKVLNLLSKQFQKHISFNIKQMICIFKSQKLEQIQTKIADIKKKIIESIDKEDQEETDRLQYELSLTQQNLKKISAEIQNQVQKDQIQCDKMIIIMSSQQDKGQIIHEYDQGICQHKDYSKYFQTEIPVNIKIEQAPQPNQIIWQNLCISDPQRKKLLIQGWILTFLFLIVTTGVFYFILKYKTKLFMDAMQMEQSSTDQNISFGYKCLGTFIVFSSFFGVVIFNKTLLIKVIGFFVNKQRHSHSDHQNFSFALKYAIGMFFTTAIMTLSVEALTYNNFYSHQYGLIQEETIMFFTTAFLIPLIWIINPYNLWKKWKLKQYVNTLVEQKKANQLIQKQTYNLGKRYAEIFQIMWFTFLYSKLIPLGSFLVLIGLILYYWVDKYNFLRRSVLKSGISGKMTILGLKSLDATLFLTYAGQIIFNWLIRDQFEYLSLILMIVGVGYLFLPVTQLIWHFNHEKFRLQQKQYQEVIQTFKYTYTNLHPVYKIVKKKQIQIHRQQVNQYTKNQLKRVRLYGVGSGYMRHNQQRRRTLMFSENIISSKYII